MTNKFKNSYSQIGRKEGFKVKYEAEDMTDQSQLTSASITEMARRYGIDAIMSKAKQSTIEAESAIAGHLYGIDLTNGFKSREELMNTKKKLKNLFENIPAQIRKDVFKDSEMEFINAYTSHDETKLSKLAEIGLVSQTQMEAVRTYNEGLRKTKTENIKREQFIKELEKQQGALYEKFKETGTITINTNTNNTTGSTSVQTGIPETNK